MLDIAVIGLGSVGLRHARNALALGCRVTGFDFDPVRCKALEDAGGRVAGTRDDALDGVAAAIVAGPNPCHLEDLAASVAAGCHTLVEKPLAHETVGLEAVLGTAESAGLIVMVGFNLRFHPCVLATKIALAEGLLGEPLWARLICSSNLSDWRPAQDHRRNYAADPKTGGVLFDLSHEFDLASLLLGPARTVAAAARCSGVLEIESDDCGDVVLRHESGVQSNLHLDFVTRPARRVTEIAGTNGVMTIDLNARSCERKSCDGTVVDRRDFDGSFDDDYVDEVAAFLAAIAGGGEDSLACTGREGLAVLELVQDARRLSGLPAS